jgi:putative FmdB family regulatory protein
MPIYEYACKKCSENFAILQWTSEEEAETACPRCGSKDIKKIISSFSCSSADTGSSSGGSFSGFSGGG